MLEMHHLSLLLLVSLAVSLPVGQLQWGLEGETQIALEWNPGPSAAAEWRWTGDTVTLPPTGTV